MFIGLPLIVFSTKFTYKFHSYASNVRMVLSFNYEKQLLPDSGPTSTRKSKALKITEANQILTKQCTGHKKACQSGARGPCVSMVNHKKDDSK